MEIDRAYLEATLRTLVATPSVNPAFGGEGEADIARYVAGALHELGMQAELLDAAPGRTSVVGRRPGRGGGRSLLLYAHLDTVGVEGMEAPFAAEVREGRVYGRGAYDMKGGMAACLAAAKAIADAGVELAGDLLVVGVADEEEASIGMTRVLQEVRADAAIVTEPTELAVCLAHKGFCWIEVETLGRAAHGSRFQDGIDANLRMGRVLHHLEALERDLRAAPPHPLVGPPSLHAATLRGGTGASTYAARCRLEIERRTIPGETPEAALAEVQAIVDRLEAADPSFRASVRLLLAREPFQLPPDARIAHTLRGAATHVLGRPPAEIGVAYWMDAALLAAAGIETVVIGAAGAGAHAAEEWVDLDSVATLARILAQAAVQHCGAADRPATG